MKKYLSSILIILLMFSIVGCNMQKENSSDSYPTTVSECITEKNDVQYLVLPTLKKEIKINDEDVKLLINNIDMDLLKAAEDKLTETYSDIHLLSPDLRLTVSENKLYLCAEAIVNIEGYTGDDSGCGLDHDHIYVYECITK